MARPWGELSQEDRILRLLNETAWLIHALGRRTPDGIVIAARRLWYTLGEVLGWLTAAEEVRQAQMEILKDDRKDED